jgi:hypothetical protein
MYLSVATTHHPATDLGFFLLHKHPERLHETELPFGKALVFDPEANEARCEAALVKPGALHRPQPQIRYGRVERQPHDPVPLSAHAALGDTRIQSVGSDAPPVFAKTVPIGSA